MEIKRGDIWYVSKDNYTGLWSRRRDARQSSSPTRRQRLCRDGRGRIPNHPTEEDLPTPRSHPQL